MLPKLINSSLRGSSTLVLVKISKLLHIFSYIMLNKNVNLIIVTRLKRVGSLERDVLGV